VADIQKVWAAAQIAVLPSRREGLPKSLLEAAACGHPIDASDVPGCREIARNGVNALLVPPDDPAALAAAIEQLAYDPALRMRFGAARRAGAWSRSTLQATVSARKRSHFTTGCSADCGHDGLTARSSRSRG
jgi:glycosyltransferase involved in cell wall biosynthesis